MSRRAALSAFVLLALLAFALRLHRLGEVSLRGDEGFSAQYWAGLPLSQSLATIATLEPHPPLTYAIFRAWGLVFGIGDETLLRLLPTLANLLGLPALYALAYRLAERRAALFIAALWAVHPYLIWHSQDFRNYALWSGLSAITLWLGLRSVQQRQAGWPYFLMALVSSLVFYTELFSLAALFLWGVWHNWGKQNHFWLRRWFGMHTILVMIVGFTFISYQGALLASGGYGGNTGGFDLQGLATRLLPTFALGDTLPAWALSTAGLFMLASLPLAWAFIAGQQRSSAALLATLILVPLLALSLVSLRVSIFNARYILASLPAYLLTFSLALTLLWRTRPSLSAALMAVWLAAAGLSLGHYFNDSAFSKSPQWRELVSYLNQRLEPGDYVLQTTVDAGFGYYFGDATRNKALPYTPTQSQQDILNILQPIAQQHTGLWLIGQTPRDWPNHAVVADWLDAQRQVVFEDQVYGFRIRAYRPWQPSADEQNRNPQAFGNAAQLLGLRLMRPNSTGQLTLWTSWQSLNTTAAPHKLFVHLIGTPQANGSPLWAQHDHFPQAGRIDSSTWEDGLLWRDVATLEIGHLPQGDYSLLIGWYEPGSGQRLLTSSGADHLVIAHVSRSEAGWQFSDD